jgi:hypothetical protein
MFAALIASAALAAQPVVIVVDTRHVCGQGRVAEYQRERAESEARQIAYRLRGEGKKVKIVRADGRLTISPPHSVRVTSPGC